MTSRRPTTAESIEQVVTGLLGFCFFAPVGVSQAFVGWIGDSWWARAGYAAASVAAALLFLGMAVYGFTHRRPRNPGENNR